MPNQCKAVFEIHKLNGIALPHAQEVYFSSVSELLCLQHAVEECSGALEQWLLDNNVLCAEERKGNAIAELTVEGNWRCLPDNKEFEATPPVFPSVMVKPRPTFTGKLKNLIKLILNRAGLLSLSQKAAQKIKLRGNDNKEAYCGPAKIRTSGNLEYNKPFLMPGYGDGLPDGALRRFPMPHSFVGWLVADGLNSIKNDIVLAFNDYPGFENDLTKLHGLLQPWQHIAIKSQKKIALLEQWKIKQVTANGYTVYACPPAEWLRGRQWLASNISWPKISVVVPSFNQAPFVRQALNSIFLQDYPNLETIVLDPGSTDGTRDILREYSDKISHLILEPDKGQSDALQRGLNMASGQILTWLCTDDMLEPDSLFRAADAFMRYKSDIVVGGCRRIDEEGRELERHFAAMPFLEAARLDTFGMIDMLHGWQAGHFFYQPEVFFTKDIWQRAGAFLHQSAYYGMDYDMWVRMAMAGATGVQLFHYFAASRAQENQKTQLGEKPVYLWQALNYLKHYQNIMCTAYNC